MKIVSLATVWAPLITDSISLTTFLKLVFTPCKAEQLLQGMELQEKEAQKD